MSTINANEDFTEKLLTDQILIARVITQATAIETIVNAYIAEYYTRCPEGDYKASYLAFIYDVMNDRGMTLDTKVKVLLKIYVRMFGKENKPSKSLFDKWLNIRNKFAHGSYIAEQGILYSGEFFEVKKLAEYHAELQQTINRELDKLAELRGPYFNHFPTKEWEKNK